MGIDICLVLVTGTFADRVGDVRIFTQAEVDLARARMPTEVKPLTGLFKWKDIKRWHTTWHAWLCKLYCHTYDLLTGILTTGNSPIVLCIRRSVWPVGAIQYVPPVSYPMGFSE